MITKIKSNWYSLEKIELKKKLETDFKKGLTKKQVSERQKKYGKNVLVQGQQITFWYNLLIHLKSPFVFILIIVFLGI